MMTREGGRRVQCEEAWIRGHKASLDLQQAASVISCLVVSIQTSIMTRVRNLSYIVFILYGVCTLYI